MSESARATLGERPEMSPLERARAGLDVTMVCAEGDHNCRGIVRWDSVPVGHCACECHREPADA